MNREYGRRLYVDGKYDMSKVTEKLMNDEFIVRNSEFKKPYLFRDYAKMEYGWNPTHWDGGGGFDMPSNFDSLRRKGQGYPGLGSRVYRFGGCEDVEIDYTTLNMLNNETQELGIKNGKSFAIYSWQVSGTNSNISNLDTALQTTDSRGEAPPNLFTPSGIQSNDSVTFQLIDRGIDEICDEITITVRCSNGSWVLESDTGWVNTDCGGTAYCPGSVHTCQAPDIIEGTKKTVRFQKYMCCDGALSPCYPALCGFDICVGDATIVNAYSQETIIYDWVCP